MFFSRSGALVKLSVSCGQRSDPSTRDRPEMPRRRLLADRHEAAVEQDPPPVHERAAARSPDSRPRAPAPRYRHRAPPARSPPPPAPSDTRLAPDPASAGTATGAAASRASISARIPVFQASRCTCQTPSQQSTTTPNDAEEQRHDHPPRHATLPERTTASSEPRPSLLRRPHAKRAAADPRGGREAAAPGGRVGRCPA